MRTIAIAVFALLAHQTTAHAQIDRPGAHQSYTAELEPHLVVQWDEEPFYTDDGFGLGFRASIPLVDNGPVKTINNNMGIGFGLDWAHFDGCYWGRNRVYYADDGCDADDFWLPFVMQWNFFFSDLISAFFEPGLAIQHTRWDFTFCGDRICSGDGDDTDLEFVLWLGMRLHFSKVVGLTLRLGRPSLTLGASFWI